MRIINVIEIKEGVVNNITSFGIFEEQLSDDVVKQAEKLYIEKCVEYGYEENDDDNDILIEDGYYSGGNFSINLVWSDI